MLIGGGLADSTVNNSRSEISEYLYHKFSRGDEASNIRYGSAIIISLG